MSHGERPLPGTGGDNLSDPSEDPTLNVAMAAVRDLIAARARKEAADEAVEVARKASLDALHRLNEAESRVREILQIEEDR